MRLHGGMEGREGELYVCGVKATDLAAEYGTPLYIYSEDFIRAQCKAIVDALAAYPVRAKAYYASKAYPCAAIERLVNISGLGIDVSSLGEMKVAQLAGVRDIIAHGSVKDDEYIDLAIACGALLVIDSFGEIGRVQSRAALADRQADVLLRVNPGVEAETHKAVRTANLDTKFGVPLQGGLALTAVKSILAQPNIRLRGVHCHVGSQVFKVDVYDVAAGILLAFMQEAMAQGARDMNVLDIGGGFGCWYSRGDTPLPLHESVQTIVKAVVQHCQRLKMETPSLFIEPGRAVVAESAVAIYTAKAVKEIPGVNHYVVTDGGLYENPRVLMYGARYSAFLPGRLADKPERYYTLSGMCCEADTVLQHVKLPLVREGDYIAVPSAGAYQLAYAGSYNRNLRPAAVLVSKRRVALIQRRQTYEEMLSCEVLPSDI